MLKDLIIIPNFFDNPKEILDLAKKQKYYKAEEHPTDGKSDKIYWRGNRSKDLSSILDNDYYKNFTNSFWNKIIRFSLAPEIELNFNIDSKFFFHYFLDEDQHDTNWLHQDSTLMAGVLYLNKCELPNRENYGTVVYDNSNNRTFSMPYEFNTLILYRSDYVHSPLSGFGDCLENSRLTINFFIKSIDLFVKRDTL